MIVRGPAVGCSLFRELLFMQTLGILLVSAAEDRACLWRAVLRLFLGCAAASSNFIGALENLHFSAALCEQYSWESDIMKLFLY